MTTTRRTLLERVKDPRDREAWGRFFDLYAPLLERYARTMGLPAWDAEEIRDQVLLVVSTKLEAFEYDPTRGGFKGWLHGIVRGKVVDHLRRSGSQSDASVEWVGLEDSAPSPDESWEREWRREHLRHALDQARRTVGDRVFEAFRESALDGRPAVEVAERLDLTVHQVYKARPKVLAAVREALARLGLDDAADLGI